MLFQCDDAGFVRGCHEMHLLYAVIVSSVSAVESPDLVNQAKQGREGDTG
jgi:hypothetical protein